MHYDKNNLKIQNNKYYYKSYCPVNNEYNINNFKIGIIHESIGVFKIIITVY